MMKAIALAGILAASLTAVPAKADSVSFSFQFGNAPHVRVLPAHDYHRARVDVRDGHRILRNHGYRHIDYIGSGRGSHSYKAWRKGRLERVRVSIRSGEIVDRDVLISKGFYAGSGKRVSDGPDARHWIEERRAERYREWNRDRRHGEGPTAIYHFGR